ncbi:MAG: alanine--tRNA ligase [Deltaproteobacteria bacterium]|jgi:alanyl-tRNA synthetase|nr:alanine--tRNA ligase [Deltaproteobacteria bacterium]
MLSFDLRNKFLDFFASHGHRKVSSSSLVPHDDPSLLFTNAGMVQFKRVFTGEEKRDYSRATTAQKCVRAGGKHNDLENVGYTARHHTFFEMLGNFSFGDYFKKEAINFAWELLTVGFKLPEDKLYATVFQDDDESFGLWETEIGLPSQRILRLGEKDNFWSMGDTGPCGPCSEILIDQGPELGCEKPDCGPGCDCDRYLEIWNLVFMQFERDKSGKMTPLPRPSIDTGLGLERLAAVKQNVRNNYESDIFRPLLDEISNLSGVPYQYGRVLATTDPQYQLNVSLRVIADHARSVTFLIADGVRPENLGRGYVLRRILRRAIRHGRKLGLTQPFLAQMCQKVSATMSGPYPELLSLASYIETMVTQEELRFRETLEGGLKMLSEAMEELRALDLKVLPGSLLFKLYDTFGFPIDLVGDISREHGFSIDEPGFLSFMEEQRAKGRAAWKGDTLEAENLLTQVGTLTSTGFTTAFLGYETCSAKATPALILRAGERVSSAQAGDDIILIFQETPFYAASGGQESDTGEIQFPQGTVAISQVTKAPSSGVFLHHGTVTSGQITVREAELKVDTEKRQKTANNHSATHLLHKALRRTLGDHVRQAGSLVSPERLRFDFTHFSPLTQAETDQIEASVTKDILADYPVETAVMDMEEAVRSGALALFEERYGEKVRVVSMGESRELCGGTHTSRTGQIGPFLISSESSVGSGVRRVECLTGEAALEKIQQDRRILAAISVKLKAPPSELLERITKLSVKPKEPSATTLHPNFDPKEAVKLAQKFGEVSFLGLSVPAETPKDLREVGDRFRDLMGTNSVIALAANAGDKAILLVMVGKELTQLYPAGKIISQMALKVGGKGGGRADLAQAGGPNLEGIPQALEVAKNMVEALV